MTESFSGGSVEHLSAYLEKFNVPVNNWGIGSAKEVSHLLAEIENGDCELTEEHGQLIRRVHFINVSILAKFDGSEHLLIEDRQVFNEGMSNERVRERKDLGGSVKEKIHSSENLNTAVARAIQEELGVRGKVSYKHNNSEDMDKESQSFPGLRTQYRAHYFTAELKGDQIRKEGYKEVQPDKTTYFVWSN